jgi:dGTPase
VKANQRAMREQQERERLAPFAVFSGDSLGRRHAEDDHSMRLAFERDRDRVLHSRCFRRLEYKTQVFVNGTSDHYRTRLTHTMEMAAVCRTLARLYAVNEDLTEAIALAHDIGHTPFGHCGEHELDALMQAHGGFDHNQQSLRWVEFLEPQYPGFDGLNLSWEVRAGLLKHTAAAPGAALAGVPIGPHQNLEAQIADIADDMTYYAHDVDDALEAGLLTRAKLQTQSLWCDAEALTQRQYRGLSDEQLVRISIRNLLDIMVRDVAENGRKALERLAPQSHREIMGAPTRIMAFSPDIAASVKQFHDFLYREVYWSPLVVRQTDEAKAMMRQLFHHYREHPDAMGRKAQARIEREGLARTVCDYLSGFTDRYALEEHARFVGG